MEYNKRFDEESREQVPKVGVKSKNRKPKVDVNSIEKRGRRRAFSTGNTDNFQQTLMSVWNKLKEKAGLQASSDTDRRNNMVAVKLKQGGEKPEPDGHVEV